MNPVLHAAGPIRDYRTRRIELLEDSCVHACGCDRGVAHAFAVLRWTKYNLSGGATLHQATWPIQNRGNSIFQHFCMSADDAHFSIQMFLVLIANGRPFGMKTAVVPL
jgi:hypothetical protein